MVGRLMQQDKFALAGIFLSMAQQNARGMALNFRKLAIEGEIENMTALEQDLNEFISDFSRLDVEELSVAEMSQRLQAIIFKYKIRVPGSIFLILRALAILDGIGKIVHPEFNAFDYIKPYGLKILKEQFSLENIGVELFYAGNQFASLMYTLPLELRSILRKIRNGKILMQIEHQGFDVFMRKLDTVTNKFVFAIIIAALTISGSITVTGNLPKESLTGLPYISLLQFMIAIALSFVLFVSLMGSDEDNDKKKKKRKDDL
jgi:ubiquinone biosynthesis protein